MADIITNLHPDGDKNTNLYPNIKKQNIPSKSISTDKLDDNVLSLIGSLKPSGTDTSTNILAFTSNKGIYVATDNGHWYYWNGSVYADGGVYQASEIADGSITPKKTSFLKNQESDNIFLYPDIEENTLNGITYKVKNGVIYLNGTATSNFELRFSLENVLVVGNTYSFDMFTRDPSINPATHMTRLYYGANDFIDDYMPQRTFVAKTTVLVITTYVFNGQTVNNLQIKPFVISGSERPQYYFNSDVYKPINSFNGGKSLIVVAKDGTGDYSTIQEAVDNAGDTPNSPVTIYLKPGIYDEVIKIRETRNLSFVGVNRDKCIWINKTGKYANAPLYIAGDFYIENITFKMTIDGANGWIPTFDNNDHDNTYPGYALHIDYYSKNPDIVNTGRCVNCKFYSQAYPAVGLGVHKKQFIIFENCEFEREIINNAYIDSYEGAIIAHCSQETFETNQNLILKNCVFVTNTGKAAYLLCNLAAAEYFTLYAINNTFYSKTDGNTITYLKGNSILSPLSHGNNISSLNNG